MNSGVLSIPIGNGRIQCTTAVPVGYAPNAIPFTGGLFCVGPGVAPRNFNAGLGYGPNGRICIDTTGAAIANFNAGLGITATGLLACDTAAPVTGFVHGLPVTAQGRLAISPPVAGAARGLTDLDDDEKPDTLLLDTPGGGPDVTIDDDSINIDLDGDGRADVVVPI